MYPVYIHSLAICLKFQQIQCFRNATMTIFSCLILILSTNKFLYPGHPSWLAKSGFVIMSSVSNQISQHHRRGIYHSEGSRMQDCMYVYKSATENFLLNSFDTPSFVKYCISLLSSISFTSIY